MARVADQSERYDGMVQFLTDVIKSNGEDLKTEERSLLSVGFKNLIYPRNLSIKQLITIKHMLFLFYNFTKGTIIDPFQDP